MCVSLPRANTIIEPSPETKSAKTKCLPQHCFMLPPSLKPTQGGKHWTNWFFSPLEERKREEKVFNWSFFWILPSLNAALFKKKKTHFQKSLFSPTLLQISQSLSYKSKCMAGPHWCIHYMKNIIIFIDKQSFRSLIHYFIKPWKQRMLCETAPDILTNGQLIKRGQTVMTVLSTWI